MESYRGLVPVDMLSLLERNLEAQNRNQQAFNDLLSSLTQNLDSGGGGADVPVATPTTPGKIKPGASLRVAADGTLEVDPALLGGGLVWSDATLIDGPNVAPLPDGQVLTQLLFLPGGGKSTTNLLPLAAPPHPPGGFRFLFGAPDGPVAGKLGREIAVVSGGVPLPPVLGASLAVASIVPSGAGGLSRSVTLTGREEGQRTFVVRVKQGTSTLKTFTKNLDAGVSTFDFSLTDALVTGNGTYVVEVEDQQYPAYRPSKTFQVTEISAPVVCTLQIASVTPGSGTNADKYTVVLAQPQAGSTLYRVIHKAGGVERANYVLTLTGNPLSFVFDKDDVGTDAPGSYQITVKDEVTGCQDTENYVVPQPAPPPAPACTLLVAQVQNGIDNNPKRRGIFLSGAKNGTRTYQYKLYKAGVLFYTSPSIALDVASYPSINFNDELVGITANGTDYSVEVRDLGPELSTCPPAAKGFAVSEYAAGSLTVTGIQRQGKHLFKVALSGYQAGVRNYVLRIEPQNWNGVSPVPQPGRLVAVDLSAQSVGGALLFDQVYDGVRANGTYVVRVWEGALTPVPGNAAQGTYVTSDFAGRSIALSLDSALTNSFSWAYSGEAYEAPTGYDLQYTAGAADFTGAVVSQDMELFTSGPVLGTTQGTTYRARVRGRVSSGAAAQTRGVLFHSGFNAGVAAINDILDKPVDGVLTSVFWYDLQSAPGTWRASGRDNLLAMMNRAQETGKKVMLEAWPLRRIYNDATPQDYQQFFAESELARYQDGTPYTWSASYIANWNFVEPHFSSATGVAAVRAFMSQLAQLLAPYAASGTLVGLIPIAGKEGEMAYPYDHDTGQVAGYSAGELTAFRADLGARYGTIAALNTAWGTSHASFGVIPWPLIPTPQAPQFAVTDQKGRDWMAFRQKALRGFYEQCRAGIREGIPASWGVPTILMQSGLGGAFQHNIAFSATNLGHWAGLGIEAAYSTTGGGTTLTDKAAAIDIQFGTFGSSVTTIFETDTDDWDTQNRTGNAAQFDNGSAVVQTATKAFQKGARFWILRPIGGTWNWGVTSPLLQQVRTTYINGGQTVTARNPLAQGTYNYTTLLTGDGNAGGTVWSGLQGATRQVDVRCVDDLMNTAPAVAPAPGASGALFSNVVSFVAGPGPNLSGGGGSGPVSEGFSLRQGLSQGAAASIGITAQNVAGKIRLTDTEAPSDNLSGGYTRRYFDRTYFTDRGASLAFLQDLPPYYDGILVKSIDQGMNWWDFFGSNPNLIREISFAAFNTGSGQ